MLHINNFLPLIKRSQFAETKVTLLKAGTSVAVFNNFSDYVNKTIGINWYFCDYQQFWSFCYSQPPQNAVPLSTLSELPVRTCLIWPAYKNIQSPLSEPHKPRESSRAQWTVPWALILAMWSWVNCLIFLSLTFLTYKTGFFY